MSSKKEPSKADYEVGYGKPPQHTRFKPGQSGNARGRPRKSKELNKLIQAELDGMAKASIERLKGFLTTSVDNYRAAYARRAGRYRGDGSTCQSLLQQIEGP